MKFAEPIWLVVGLAVCAVLVATFRHSGLARRRALERFAAGHLLPQLTASVSPQLRLLKQILWVVAVACLFVALARPQWGFYWEEKKRRGIDVLLAIDTSKSMLAQDVKPDRLTRAKLAISDLLEEIGGDRVGLIAFAGDAFLQCPLTLDHAAFAETLNAIDTSIIARGGTDVSAALGEAEAAFANEPKNYKVLVLLTDGEDLEGRAIEAARHAAAQGIKVYTVGVGSAAGELIPVPDGQGGVEILKDDKGVPVKSKLDEGMLRQIAEATGGAYEPLGSRGEGLIKIYNDYLKTLPQHDLASRQERVYYERFQWPLGLAIALFIIELLLIERRTTVRHALESNDIRPARRIAVRRSGRGRTPAAVAAFALLCALGLNAQASPGSAEKAYQKGDYKKALEEYSAAQGKDPDRPELQYNVGAAAYKEAKWEEASRSFQTSLNAKDPALVQQASYNLGNTLYRIGQQTEKSNPQQTISAWEQSVQAYEGALRLKDDDADAKYNLEFVKKKLEELKKQQPPPPPQKDQQKDQQQQQDQQQNQDKDQQQNQQNQDQNKDQQNKDRQQQNQNQQNQQNPNQNQPDKNQQQNAQQNPQNGGNKPEDKKNADNKNQPGQKPQPKDGDQKGQQAKNGEKPGEEGPEEVRPGKMTRGEARNLLDSAKGDEKKVFLLNNSQAKPHSNDVKKDW